MVNQQKYCFFFSFKNQFSNLHPSKFKDGKDDLFINVEQYMMHRKAILFKDIDSANKILNLINNFHPDSKEYKLLELYINNKITVSNIINDEQYNYAWKNINKTIKTLGRNVKNFDNKVWDSRKEKIVYDGSIHKYNEEQNDKILKKLMSTNDEILVEASPYDKIWGIGYGSKDALEIIENWGQNLLGKILMDVRNHFRNI